MQFLRIMINTRIFFSCRSDVGLVRKNNEDNFYCNGETLNQEKIFLNGTAENPCIFAVCDGMGGEEHGELASLITVQTLCDYAEKIKSAALSKNKNNLDEAVQFFISKANSKICKIMRENSFRMGTTLALVVISSDLVMAYNIGDSRIYKIQNGVLSQISEDHTVAEQKIKMGLLTRKEARHDKSRHVLTRCLGIFEDEMILTPDIISPFNIENGLRLLLCSDGLTDMLSDPQIHDILLANNDSQYAVNTLVASALQNGGRDNITCLIIDFASKGAE